MRKRNNRVEVYLNDTEYENFCDLCRKTNLKKTTLIRYLIEGYRPVEAPPADYHKLIREIRAVGNNLNQTLVIAKTNGILSVPDLRKEITDLREVEKELREVFKMRKLNNHGYS